ncbi:DUF3987 domain-containing protein [Solimonas flava]|uniref:DUF3987 domain-containing protein n=1 Tax=Solimonas flava TaxID=415849 RepID=UPI0004846796|nr:DUF3987 domain-containing protein [Solimonas flava]
METNLDRAIERLQEELEAHLNAKPVAPSQRQMIYSDASLRALLEAAEGDGRSFALASAEGAGIFDGEVMANSAFINCAWDGDIPAFNRAHGKSASVKDARMTVALMVQPDVLGK